LEITDWWINQIKNNFNTQHLPAIQEYLRIPSISATGEGIQIVPTEGWPVVYGELISDPQKPTVIFYSMYDVQPVEPEKWQVPPFDGKIVEDFEGMGRALVSRGVINTKGPTMAFFQTIRTIVDAGRDLPVNIIFVIEGEEELGSIHFPDFVDKFAEHLTTADVVYFPSFSETLDAQIGLWLRVRGIIYFKVWVQGGSWGGPQSRNIHSALGSLVSSPTWKLIHLISKMRAPNGDILIPGIYDNVRPISEEDMEIIKESAQHIEIDVLKKSFDVHTFLKSEVTSVELSKEELVQKFLTPCLTVDGIISGYAEEEGTKTVLPYKAFANMDIRLVPDMEVEDIRNKIASFIKSNAPEAQFDIETGYKWAKMSPSHPYVKGQIELYRETGKKMLIWPSGGGSAPFYIFQDKLNLPFILGGLGHGTRAHSPNEYAFLESKTGAGGIMDFEISVARLLSKIGEIGKVK
jgi:acetylornithine deacetylase/succinyl-diaminopimelate desuccinylase-like protein